MRRPQVSYKFQEVIQYAPLNRLVASPDQLLMICARAGTNCPASPRFPATMPPSVRISPNGYPHEEPIAQ